MPFYHSLVDKIALLEHHIKQKSLKEQETPWYLELPEDIKITTRAPREKISFVKMLNIEDTANHLKLLFLKFILFLTRGAMMVRRTPSSNFHVFTKADRDGVYICNYSYCHYKTFNNKAKYKFLAMVTAATIIVSLIVALVFPGKPIGYAATNTWNQTDWSLGADIAAIANHIANQTGWQKFYSKDANVNVSTVGQISLSATTSGITETTTADFAAGTQSNTGVSNNSVLLLKPEGAGCTTAGECFYGVCASSTCSAFVTIGTKLWMKYNLNVGTRIAGSANPTNNGVVEKYCYSDTEANCTTDGGLYQWNEAMGYAATCNGTGSGQPACTTPVQGICPSGTHIPSHYEYTLLEKSVGSNPGAFPYDTTTTGWLGTNEGTNLKTGGSSGFAGILVGDRETNGTFVSRGSSAYFWSSTESGANAWYRYLGSTSATVGRVTNDKAYGFSVRCLKN